MAHARWKMFNARDNHPRHAAVKPIWERMRECIAGEAIVDVLPKESFGQALTYIRNQFDHLLVYLDDGRVPIDNNLTEQLMKKVVIGRKNWLFVGEVEPSYRAADCSRFSAAPSGMISMSCPREGRSRSPSGRRHRLRVALARCLEGRGERPARGNERPRSQVGRLDA